MRTEILFDIKTDGIGRWLHLVYTIKHVGGEYLLVSYTHKINRIVTETVWRCRKRRDRNTFFFFMDVNKTKVASQKPSGVYNKYTRI